ncbi:MAG: NUDIX hydrolase [Candidatus Saccharibacteria bacterium]
MKTPIVDRDDNVICYKERADIDYDKDIFRAASLWITKSNGDVLLTQRKFTKKVDAGKWGEAVGGTVEGHDSYEDTIIREAAEELGLNDIKIQIGPKQFLQTETYSVFVQWYTTCIDKDVSELEIQEEEVEEALWMPVAEFKNDLTNNPKKYASDFIECVKLLEI